LADLHVCSVATVHLNVISSNSITSQMNLFRMIDDGLFASWTNTRW